MPHGRLDHVIAVILSSALSGTFANAEAAARRMDSGHVTVLDGRSLTLGQGLLLIRGVELAATGWMPDAIVRELQRVRSQSGGFFTVPRDADHTGDCRTHRDRRLGSVLSE